MASKSTKHLSKHASLVPHHPVSPAERRNTRFHDCLSRACVLGPSFQMWKWVFFPLLWPESVSAGSKERWYIEESWAGLLPLSHHHHCISQEEVSCVAHGQQLRIQWLQYWQVGSISMPTIQKDPDMPRYYMSHPHLQLTTWLSHLPCHASSDYWQHCNPHAVRWFCPYMKLNLWDLIPNDLRWADVTVDRTVW